MFENSVIIRSVFSFCVFWRSVYENSLIKRGVDLVFQFFKEVFRYSVLYPIFAYESLKIEARPFYIKQFQKIYTTCVATLHSAYCRGRDNSFFLRRIGHVGTGAWFENSFIVRGLKHTLGSATLEGVLLSFFVLLVPFINKELSLVMAFGVFGIFLLSAIIRNNQTLTVTKATVFAGLYFIMIVINSFLSINPSGSMRDLAIHTGGVLVLFAIVNSPLTKRDYDWMFNALIFAGLLVSIYAMYQYIADVPMGSGWVDASENPGLTVRVFGTFENPNTFAEFLIMVLPLTVARGLKNLSEKKWLSGLSFGIPAGAMVVALLLTASRAGWLGFAFGTVIFVLLLNMKFIIPIIFGGVVAFPLLPESILQRIGTIGSLSDSSNLYRYNLWKSAVEIIKDFFVTGIGTGYLAFREITPYYMKNMAPYHTHNTYIQTLVEFGIVGLMIFLVWCFILFKEGANTALGGKNFTVRVYAAALTAGFCSVMLHGIAEHILYYSKIMLLFWVMIGLIIKAKDLNAAVENE
ncbi:MAG: O-antigen ligase family protein [Clostridia bacterium]|nr:O-antigen ligase family protein [Clostridia bacterium]